MSLQPDLHNAQKPVGFSSINHAAHDELAREVEAFLAKGGAVNSVTNGASAKTQPKLNKHQTKLMNGPIRERALSIDCKNRSKYRSRFGQNIFERGGAGERYYVVIINAEHFGSGEGWSLKQAKKNRDRIRANRGLPPAEY